MARLKLWQLILLVAVLSPLSVWAANTMISALGTLTESTVATTDRVHLLDVSDTTEGAGGTNKTITVEDLKDFIENQFIGTAGSDTAGSWMKLASGTLQTTPDDDSIENDGNAFYLTTDAGNRGVVSSMHLIRQAASRTLPNDTNENAIFNSVTNGRITLETGTYRFGGMLYVTGMSATSGNFLIDVLGAGTAVCGDWLWQAWGIDASGPTGTGNKTGTFTITQQSAASVVTAAVGTGAAVQIEGMMEVTTAGTLIPSLDQVTAAAATLAAGSYFWIERVGPIDMVSVGQWD